MAEKKPDWTKEQQNILDAKGNVLVSASAGSGKTTVMVRRIIDIIEGGADVNDVLVLTYTNASAGDMRAKIVQKLTEAVKVEIQNEDVREKVGACLDMLSFSDIGTVDAFCGKLIREYFHVLNVSPTAKQMDEIAADDMKKRVIDKVIGDEYEKASPDFLRIVEKMSKIVDDTSLSDVVIKLYDASRIHPDPEEFKRNLSQSVTDKPSSVYGRVIFEYYKELAEDMLPFAEKTANECNLHEAPAYAAAIEAAKKVFKTVAENDAPEKLHEELALCAVPSLRGKSILSDEDKNRVKKVTEAAKKLTNGVLSSLFVDYSGYDVGAAEEYVKVVMRLVDEFGESYSAEKLAADVMDFQDLSQYAIKLLSNPECAAQIAEKYKFIFVDEYQDVNPLQEEIINKISRGNTFMVGDGKQGIYAFRNAEPRIMNDRRKAYENGSAEGKSLNMTVNFRSTDKILQFCDDVFSAVMTEKHGGVDYKKTSKFISRNMTVAPPRGVDVEVRLFDDVRNGETVREEVGGVYSVMRHVQGESGEEAFGYREGMAAAKRMKELIDTPYGDENGVAKRYGYGDIAVLFRSRSKGAESYLRALTDSGIPYVGEGFVTDAGINYVKQLISFLKVIDNAEDDIAASGYLLSWFGGLNEDELYKVRAFSPKESVFGGLTAYRGEKKLAEKCAAATVTVYKWRDRSAYVGVRALLSEIITRTGFDAYVLSRPSGKSELLGVNTFVGNVDKSGCGDTVQKFLRFYVNSDRKISVPSSETVENAVRVLTAHKSKGLEFPAVFLGGVETVAKGGPEKSDVVFDKDFGIGIKLYNESNRTKMNSLAYNAIKLAASKRENDENVRLFYVAATRAQSFLYISGKAIKNMAAEMDFPKSPAAVTNFEGLLLYAAASNLDVRKIIKNEEITLEDNVVKNDNPKVIFNAPEKIFTDEIGRVVNFVYKYEGATHVNPKYTVSDLNRTEDDEGVYIPSVSGGEDNRRKGIAYHAVMENIDFSFTTLSEVNEFILSLAEKGIITSSDANLVDGSQILACINSQVVKNGIKGKYLREKPFMLRLSANEINGCGGDDTVLVQGTADLILFGRETVVIDFKYSGLSDEKLADKYEKQLKLYERAVETAFNVKVDKKLLYSFTSGRFIEIK